MDYNPFKSGATQTVLNETDGQPVPRDKAGKLIPKAGHDIKLHPRGYIYRKKTNKPVTVGSKGMSGRDHGPGMTSVREGEMDPVDKKALKGKHKDRKDKDIDNDGDVDGSDKYLHKRRKAISKAMSKEGYYKDMEIKRQDKEMGAKPVPTKKKKAAKSDKKEGDIEMNPKMDTGKSEQKESRIRSVLKSVLVEKENHSPNQDKAEKMKDNRKGKGAEDMMAPADDAVANPAIDEPDRIKKDAAKMTSNVKNAKMRKNDNPKGDRNIVPAGTPMKDPAAMKAESTYDNMSAIKAAYAAMYEEDAVEESYTHEVDYAEDGPHTAKKFMAHAKKAGIKAKIHDPSGPGGGHPVVHLGHKDDDHMHKFLKKHYDPDMEKGDLKHHKI